ncbi:hypothetical protein MTR_5g029315 [Medicago truncatula]|uniref:Uncharacterized protein n=1 Tax=Medicago truncatula TaxID=3880 RepID=A0A072UD25_MEDTR|nr:hypothetical protein MTR_5g029315 [Medicago truncatula]
MTSDSFSSTLLFFCKSILISLALSSKVNPQEKLKVLVIARLATKKVGAKPRLVPKLVGGGSLSTYIMR